MYILYHYDPTLTQNTGRFWHILGERPCRFLLIKYVTRGPDVTTALSLEKAKGCPNIWIPSGDCGWPAVQMFADMRTSHGLLASVAGQLLPLHWYITQTGKSCKETFLSFVQSLCADVATHGCACLFVCMFTCRHSHIKNHTHWGITENKS